MPFRSGFLYLSTEIWSQKYSVPCGMFTASLASLTPPTRCQLHLSIFNNQKYFQTLPSVPEESKISLRREPLI